MAQPGGQLVLHIEEAALTRDNETFGTMDPYAQVHYKGATHNSKVHSDGGKTPKWNYRLELEVTDLSDEITVKVYNKNTFSDD